MLPSRKKCIEPLRQIDRVERLAFPYDQDIPTERPQLALVEGVSLDVPFEFVCPERGTGFWGRRSVATFVPMPETSVDEYDLSQSWEDQVRCS